jgi:ArsR family transcriptional regulator
MDELLQIFKALADPTRLRILRLLTVKPLCVCEVMHVLKMAQSTTSKHLQILSRAGLIEAEPGGIWTVYRIVKKPKNPVIIESLEAIKKSKETSIIMKKDTAAAMKVNRYRICLRKIKDTQKR